MEKYLALKASAGSGKTFALTVRYISLLFLGASPNSILTLTFTNKAALEMGERIFHSLLNLGDDLIILDAISKETSLTKKEILSKKDYILKQFLSSELSIITLDKFMNKVLREFSGYVGINDDFSIEQDDYDLMLYKFLISLNIEQFNRLIDFSYQNEKKLSSIIKLFMKLDEKGETFHIQDFSYEILNRLEKEILLSGFKIKECILNSNVSNSAKKAVDFNNIKELLNVGKTWLSKDSLAKYNYFKKALGIENLDGELENIKRNLKLYYRYKEINILNNLFFIYNDFKKFRLQYKKDKNKLEFNDVTNLVYNLLKKYIDKDFLYFRLDSKYEHILIDEFQDTSVIQYKILEPLIDEILSGNDEKFKTFFYVGDTKQSIYRFRGGKKELFDYVIKKYSPLLKLQILDTNYRSSKNIVSFVNEVFEKQVNYEYYPQKVNSLNVGSVEVELIDIDNTTKYKFIKDKLEKLFKLGINPNDIAILTYTNEDVLEIYEYLKNEFKDLKIITDMTSKLINQNNVKAIINLIKYFYFNENIYKANFNSLLGFELLQEVEFFIDIKSNDLATIVYEIANFYNLIEDNVIKFINSIEKYEDIVEFIYEIDNDDSIMINKENSGLQILTIFKSKGLEFDTVFIIDRLKRKNSDTSPLLFSYNQIELNRIYYKDKIRENFDDDYKDAIENEKKLALDDELNILYVALTRAKNNLIIFKKEKQSAFDILTHPINKTIKGDISASATKQNDIDTTSLVNYTPLKLGYQEIDKKDTIENIDNLKERYFGIATHYCLEMMKKFDKDSLDFAIDLTISKYSNILEKNEFDDIYKRIELLITNNHFKSLLDGGIFFKEQELTYNDELKIIDLLIKNKNGYIIIDYKTTKTAQDSHISQVKHYKKAIKDILNKDVTGYLVYLKSYEVEFKLV